VKVVSRTTALAGVAVLGALSLSACGSDNSTSGSKNSAISCEKGDLKGAGSTFQKNIVAQWIKDYQNACTGATLDYQGIGSGGGISQFGSGTIDFAGSDSTMKPDEQAAADKRCGSPAIHIPITAGAVAIAYNLSGVDNLQLSPATLAGIFQGTITKWDDAAIKADNPGVTLPSTAITAVHREDASGTTDIVSKFLTATAPSWKLGKGKELSWPTKIQGAKGSDGVTQAVVAAEGGITYTEVSYVDNATGIKAAKVKNAGGQYVGPTSSDVSAAIGGAELPASGNDLKVSYDFTKVTAGYPITAVSYDIACTKGSDAGKQTLLKSFLTYGVTTGQASAVANGYAPLPQNIVDRDKAAIASLS
jgi:phosphate transport system substrate-binding protein